MNGVSTIKVNELDRLNISQLQKSLDTINQKYEEDVVKNDSTLRSKLQAMKNKIVKQQMNTKKYYLANKDKYPEIASSNKMFISLLQMKRIVAKKTGADLVTDSKDKVGNYNFLDGVKDVRGLAIGIGATIGIVSAADFAITGIAKAAGAEMTLFGNGTAQSAFAEAIKAMFGFNPVATVALLSVVGVAGAWFVAHKVNKTREQIAKHKQIVNSIKFETELDIAKKEQEEKQKENKKYSSEYADKKEKLVEEIKSDKGLMYELESRLEYDKELTPTMKKNIRDLLDAVYIDYLKEKIANNSKFKLYFEAKQKETELSDDLKKLEQLEATVAEGKTVTKPNQSEIDNAQQVLDNAKAAYTKAQNTLANKDRYDELAGKATRTTEEDAEMGKLEHNYPDVKTKTKDELTQAKNAAQNAVNDAKKALNTLKESYKKSTAGEEASKEIDKLAEKYEVTDLTKLKKTIETTQATNESTISTYREDLKDDASLFVVDDKHKYDGLKEEVARYDLIEKVVQQKLKELKEREEAEKAKAVEHESSK